MSYAELAEKSKLSERTLRRAVRDPSHPLPCYRIRGCIRFKWSEYDRWAQSYRHIGAPEVDRIVRIARSVLKGLR